MNKKPKAPAAKEKPATDAQAERNAKLALLPSVNAAAVIEKYQSNVMGAVSLDTLIDGVSDTCKVTRDGNLSRLEAMLVSQAMALQTIFTDLARKASRQAHLKQYEAHLGLALKAQAQSRATIQAVVELKYPRQVAFVKQANISHGAQQVNNGIATETGYLVTNTRTHAHAEEKQIQANELLEDQTHARQFLDTGTTAAAGRSNPTLETVAAIDRGNQRGRQGGK
ncbi:MAG: hypothetical protein JSS58_05945 [Proteobacteria bacterium]|nr:hypothetical protein [Pseudomonadota bacterium]